MWPVRRQEPRRGGDAHPPRPQGGTGCLQAAAALPRRPVRGRRPARRRTAIVPLLRPRLERVLLPGPAAARVRKQTKGLIFLVIFGGSLLFWATASSMPQIPGLFPTGPDEPMTVTGTPADNFPDAQRAQFCGGEDPPSSTRFVREYRVPTECTQPLAIEVDPDGNVWFAETNTGRIARFSPDTELFNEYDNVYWPPGGRSMVWGMDYLPDGSLWYTDEANDLLWRFVIDGARYERIFYTPSADSLPQRIEAHGSELVVNDFTGGKLTLIDPVQAADAMEAPAIAIPSPLGLGAPGGENPAFTSGFDVAPDGAIWYTNWIFQGERILVRFDRPAYADAAGADPSEFMERYALPRESTTPNGVTIGADGTVWIMDTSSSYLFAFDPSTEEFAQYVTSPPPRNTFGNASGIIKTPISRPYWSDLDDSGRIVFNEQTANRIAVLDPAESTLVEYVIPSRNPSWGDCGGLADCGLSQPFDFAIDGDRIWFTEWVENNIGVVDTSVPLPFEVRTSSDVIEVEKGGTAALTMTVAPAAGAAASDTPGTQPGMVGPAAGASFVQADTSQFSDITVGSDTAMFVLGAAGGGAGSAGAQDAEITVSARATALATDHQLLLGARTGDVTVSKYVTVRILP